MRADTPTNHPILTCLGLAVLLFAPIGCGAGGGTDREPWSFAGSNDGSSPSADAAPDTSTEPPSADADPRPDGGDGAGTPDDVCVMAAEESDLAIAWTGDDDLVGWLDGSAISESNQWTDVSRFGTRDLEDGRHVLSVLVRDRAREFTGFLAKVDTGDNVEETAPECASTGADTDWRVTTDTPDDGWREVGFDDSNWQSPRVADSECVGTWNEVVEIPGAKWVWQSNCNAGADGWNERNWYRLEFEIRPER